MVPETEVLEQSVVREVGSIVRPIARTSTSWGLRRHPAAAVPFLSTWQNWPRSQVPPVRLHPARRCLAGAQVYVRAIIAALGAVASGASLGSHSRCSRSDSLGPAFVAVLFLLAPFGASAQEVGLVTLDVKDVAKGYRGSARA